MRVKRQNSTYSSRANTLEVLASRDVGQSFPGIAAKHDPLLTIRAALDNFLICIF